jgi:uncharacterized protein (TIGR03067 family)
MKTNLLFALMLGVAGLLPAESTAQAQSTPAAKDPAPKAPPAAAKATTSAPRLDGVWVVVSTEVNGTTKPADETVGLSLKLSGETYSVITKTQQIDRGTFTANPAKSPKQMDIRAEIGPYAGRTLTAIYELKDDTLQICYAIRSAERPTTFAAATNSGRLLIKYQRQQP